MSGIHIGLINHNNHGTISSAANTQKTVSVLGSENSWNGRNGQHSVGSILLLWTIGSAGKIAADGRGGKDAKPQPRSTRSPFTSARARSHRTHANVRIIDPWSTHRCPPIKNTRSWASNAGDNTRFITLRRRFGTANTWGSNIFLKAWSMELLT